MNRRRLVLAAGAMFFATLAYPQQPPKKGSYLLNDSTVPITVEYHTSAGWQALSLEPGKDGRVEGDRARIASKREDAAMLTVDLPLAAGEKYRIFWNSRTNMWDIAHVTP